MRTADGYKTRQRKALEDILKETKGHITVDMMMKLLAERGESVGRTTVWRGLERLVAEGRVRKYVQQGESACYQYLDDNGGCREHFHLKCEKCGRLIHMECEKMGSLAAHIEQGHGFRINPLKTVFYGVCTECDIK